LQAPKNKSFFYFLTQPNDDFLVLSKSEISKLIIDLEKDYPY
jgi:hypothetical protein